MGSEGRLGGEGLVGLRDDANKADGQDRWASDDCGEAAKAEHAGAGGLCDNLGRRVLGKKE
jgi:hypothetical protein